VGIVLVYGKLHVESVSVLSSSQKFKCVFVFYMCDSKRCGNNKKKKNRILGLETCAVAEEAL
jgi:hypothetical protein